MGGQRRVILLAILGAAAASWPARAELDAGAEGRAAAAAKELHERKEQSRMHVAPPAEGGPTFPHLRGEVLIELRSDADLDSTARDQYVNVEPALSIGLSEHFSIEAGFVLEPVADPPPGRNRWFDDEGFFVETFFLRWEWDRFSLHAGKFNPAFGFAWELAPGIYGADFAEDYEITERIGFGGTVEFGNAGVGRHRLGIDAFFVDTSPLSRSLLHDRGRTRWSDGGPSNTLSPESFSIDLRGGGIPRLPGLAYNLGFSNQHRADAGGRSERATVAGLSYGFSLLEDLEVELLSEYAHLRHAEGESENRHYFTQSAGAYWGGWNVAISFTGRWVHGREDGSRHDFLLQASAGYAWEIGAGGRFGTLGSDIAWRRAREDGVCGDGFGVLVSYVLGF